MYDFRKKEYTDYKIVSIFIRMGVKKCKTYCTTNAQFQHMIKVFAMF